MLMGMLGCSSVSEWGSEGVCDDESMGVRWFWWMWEGRRVEGEGRRIVVGKVLYILVRWGVWVLSCEGEVRLG